MVVVVFIALLVYYLQKGGKRLYWTQARAMWGVAWGGVCHGCGGVHRTAGVLPAEGGEAAVLDAGACDVGCGVRWGVR